MMDAAALDRLWDEMVFIRRVELAALAAADPDRTPAEAARAAAYLTQLLPDNRWDGYASADQLAYVRAIIGDQPIPMAAPELVRIPVLRGALRSWAAAEQRHAVVLPS